jgi:uncharacterized protein (TIGR02145 family)
VREKAHILLVLTLKSYLVRSLRFAGQGFLRLAKLLLNNFNHASTTSKIQQSSITLALLLVAIYPVYCFITGQNHKASALTATSVSPGFGISTGGTQITVTLDDLSFSKDFNTTTGTAGAAQSFTPLVNGNYRIELWGGGGGNGGPDVGPGPGKGGYTAGTINLTTSDTLNFYIGGAGGNGTSTAGGSGGLNGGGSGGGDPGGLIDGTGETGGGGGGSTDVRFNSTSINSRIMVAGGGAGPSDGEAGGPAGGLASTNGKAPTSATYGTTTLGSNQTSGAVFFQASNGSSPPTSGAIVYTRGGGGGGGGYWGGRGGPCTTSITCSRDELAGRGGSSYISGHTGAVAIASASSTAARTGTGGAACATSTTDALCSEHYSGKVFTSTVMIDGAGYGWTNTMGSQTAMLNPLGGSYALGTGNSGGGYARITALDVPTVTVGGTACTGVVLSGNIITCTTGAHTAGMVDVTVNNGIGPTATLTNSYTYYDPIAINSITSNHGTANGGTTVTITGANITLPTLPTPATVQQMTQAYCASMVVYNGTNPSVILTLNDPRGSGQQYQVAKLADGNCWMLNNLKLGYEGATDGPNGDGTTTLTSADTNITSNFVLPQVTNSGSSYDMPGVYAVPGQTNNISDDTFYGYLYNWPAATAGETTSSITTGNAPSSICPKGWRLPTGGATGDFSALSSAMAAANGSSDYLNFQPAGPFKGTFSGFIDGVYSTQGTRGGLWASSTDDIFDSDTMSFTASSVMPYDRDARNVGYAVRCMVDSAQYPIVTFDGIPATVVSHTNTEIVVKTPAHAAGLVDVAVANALSTDTLSAVYLNPAGDLTDPANVSSGYLYQDPYVAISANTPIISITPHPTSDTISSTTTQISVTTNSPTGYSLSIHTTSAGSKLVHAANSSYYISPVGDGTTTGILSNPVQLTTNTWGFALAKTTDGFTIDTTLVSNNFDNSYTTVSNQTSHTAKYARVPMADTTIKNTQTDNNEQADGTVIYYGARTATGQLAGTYRAIVTYTAVGRLDSVSP